MRRVLNIDIVKSRHENYHELHICGTSFLWHQVLCIMAVLLLIGQDRENSSVIDYLLDISQHSRAR